METAIIKSLLEVYMHEVRMTSDQLADLDNYIFHSNATFRYVHPPEIIETAVYLKETAVENKIKKSDDLLNFLKIKRKRYDKFLWELIVDEDSKEDIFSNEEKKDNPTEETIQLYPLKKLIYPDLNSYNVKSYVKTLSEYFKYFLQSLKERISDHRELTIHLHEKLFDQSIICKHKTELGTKGKFARYFEEFSSKEKNNEVIIWTHSGSANLVFEGCITKALNKNINDQFLLYPQPGKCSLEVISKAYDNIVEYVTQEQPIDDDLIKEDLMKWLLFSKMHTVESENIIDGTENISVSNETNLYTIKTQKDNYKNMLVHKQWKILKSPPGHTWLASDNPGFGINLEDLYNRPTEMVADGKLTDIREDTIIYYPISSVYCLRIQPFAGDINGRKSLNQAVIEFEQSTIEELEAVNGLTFSTKNEIVVGRDKKSFEQLEFI